MTAQPDIPAAIKRLRRLCKEATPGPWHAMDVPSPSREDPGWRALFERRGRMVGIDKATFLRLKDGVVSRCRAVDWADIAYVAALNPRVASALLDVVALVEQAVALIVERGESTDVPLQFRQHRWLLDARTALSAFAAAAGGGHG